MRRGTLTLQARYVFPVEGPPIEDGCLTIEQGRIAWVGPAKRAARRPGPGQRGDRARASSTRTRTSSWQPLAGNGRPAPSGSTRTRSPGCGGSSSSGAAGDEQSLAAKPSARNVKAVDRGGDDVPGRHDDGRPELGARSPRRRCGGRLRRADRPEARPRAPDQRGGLGLAGIDPPRGPGGRLRPAGPQPARALQHLGLALPQGGGQPAAALDPPGRDARGTATARSTATARCGVSSKSSTPGTTTGSRSAPGRPTTSAAASSATPTG